MIVFRPLARLFVANSAFLYMTLFAAVSAPLSQDVALQLTWKRGAKGVVGLEKLGTFLGGSATASKVSFHGDVLLDEEELQATTGCTRDSSFDAVKIARAFAALACSQRFIAIDLFVEKEVSGVSLAWNFEGRWRFDRLKVHGLLVGKDWYAQQYQADAGMSFDQSAHDQRVKRMIRILHDNGYFDAHVADRLDKNSERKLYVAHIWPHKGKHYMFGGVQAQIEPYEEVSEEAVAEIRSFANHFLKKKLDGGRYSHTYLNAVATDLKRALTQKGFLQTRISLKEVVRRSTKEVDVSLTIKVGQCKRIVFFGNNFFPTDELFDRLLLFGQSVLLLPGSVLADELVLLYNDKGFFDVKVEVVEEREALFFVITEGSRLPILPFQPIGVSEANKPRIMKMVASFLAAKWFDSASLDRLINALKEWYAANGYLACHIKVNEPEPRVDGVAVSIEIQEGECHKVKAARLVYEGGGLPPLSFSQRLLQDIGKPMSPELIEEQRRYLLNELRDQGYTQARLHVDRKGDELEWRVSDAITKTHIGPIILSGTTKMPYKHLKRLIGKQQGLVWRQDVFKNLFNEFKQADVFSAIHLDPVGAHSMIERPVCLALYDDDPFELRVRAGAALEHVTKHVSPSGVTYRAGGTLLIKNPCNRADTIRVEADFAATQRTFELGYSQPWFLGSPARYDGMVYSHMYDQPVWGSKRTLYKMGQHGVLSSFHRKEGSWDTGITFGFEWDKTSLPDHSPETEEYIASVGKALRFEPAMIGRGVPYIFVEPTAILSTLDNALQPTKGSFSLLTVKGMVPIGGISLAESFVRFTAEQSFFVPLQKIVAAFRIRVGHIFNKQFERIMPLERFYLGGANSIRGYETDFTPPLGCFFDENCKDDGGKPKKQIVPQGGRSMINANLEFRFPLIGSLGGVVFQDAGALHDSSLAYVRALDCLAATGFGLRYQTPVGPLRFDAGWRWGSSSLPLRRFVWFLGFGSAF